MVRVSSLRKLTEQKQFMPYCCWIAYAHPVHKSILKEYGYPTLLLNGTYVANTNLLKEYSLPHIVVEWYERHEHKSLLKEYGLPHTIAEWYVRRKYKSILNEYGLPHTPTLL